MTQLGEAVDRYHKILESDAYKDLAWAHALHERMKEQQLTVAGKPISPVLRPHFITRRQYTGLTQAAESLIASINRVEVIVIGIPALLSRMERLAADKMLETVDHGYPFVTVTSL